MEATPFWPVCPIMYPQFQAQMEAGAVLVWRDIGVSMSVCLFVCTYLFMCPCLSICSFVLVLPPHAFWVSLSKDSKRNATQQPLATWRQTMQKTLNTPVLVSTLSSLFKNHPHLFSALIFFYYGIVQFVKYRKTNLCLTQGRQKEKIG